MDKISNLQERFDMFQRKHHGLGFVVAVLKRYDEDKTTFHAALFTYYAFLALFPLLLVATTVAGMIASNAPNARAAITTSVSGYFPVLGAQLSEYVTSIHKTGVPLVIGIAIALYGARGVAEVFQRGMRSIWHEDLDAQESFPVGQLKRIGIVVIGGFGLLSASILASFTSAVGHGMLIRLLSVFVNLTILFALFTYLLNSALPRHIPFRQIRAGAIAAAVGLVVLQGLGGYVLNRELHNLNAVYSYFAISLGLLFWIFLQAQVLYYAATVAVVGTNNLWPRGITDKNPTRADQKILEEKL